jgi:hypothetical protein
MVEPVQLPERLKVTRTHKREEADILGRPFPILCSLPVASHACPLRRLTLSVVRCCERSSAMTFFPAPPGPVDKPGGALAAAGQA